MDKKRVKQLVKEEFDKSTGNKVISNIHTGYRSPGGGFGTISVRVNNGITIVDIPVEYWLGTKAPVHLTLHEINTVRGLIDALQKSIVEMEAWKKAYPDEEL